MWKVDEYGDEPDANENDLGTKFESLLGFYFQRMYDGIVALVRDQRQRHHAHIHRYVLLFTFK